MAKRKGATGDIVESETHGVESQLAEEQGIDVVPQRVSTGDAGERELARQDGVDVRVAPDKQSDIAQETAGEMVPAAGVIEVDGGGNRPKALQMVLDRLDNPKKRRAIQHYINTGGQVHKSCRLAGIHHQTHYNWLAADPLYAEAYELAKQHTLDVIEAEIIRRGVKGYKEPIVYQGKITGHVRRYSDNLLMFLAKRRDPAYRDNYNLGVMASGDVTVQLQIPRPPSSPVARQEQ